MIPLLCGQLKAILVLLCIECSLFGSTSQNYIFPVESYLQILGNISIFCHLTLTPRTGICSFSSYFIQCLYYLTSYMDYL